MANTSLTQYIVDGSGLEADAWTRFNGATGVISGSLNTTSVTDNGTGDFTVNWTTSFPSANYAVGTGTAGDTGSQDDFTSEISTSNKTASAFRTATYSRGGNALSDAGTIYVVAINS